MDIVGLEVAETRRFSVRVAGPAALVVAKLHKLHERLQAGNADRIANKDAADVYRIMQAVPVEDFLLRLRPLLADPIAEAPSAAAVGFLDELFGARASRGVLMAAEALRVGVPADRVEAVCTSFVSLVRDGLGAFDWGGWHTWIQARVWPKVEKPADRLLRFCREKLDYYDGVPAATPIESNEQALSVRSMESQPAAAEAGRLTLDKLREDRTRTDPRGRLATTAA